MDSTSNYATNFFNFTKTHGISLREVQKFVGSKTRKDVLQSPQLRTDLTHIFATNSFKMTFTCGITFPKGDLY